MEKTVIAAAIDRVLGEITGDMRQHMPQEKLREDCGLDSLSMINLIVAIETEFHIFFEDSDLDPEQLITVEQMVRLTERYL